MARSATAQYFQGVVALFFFTCVKDEIILNRCFVFNNILAVEPVIE